MIPAFNPPLMQFLCEELQQRLMHFKVISCFSNQSYRFFLTLSHVDRHETLLFCFQHPFMRFHLLAKPLFPSKSSTPHPLSSFLEGSLFKKALVLNQDRILQLSFETKSGELFFIAEFFSKHPNYYVTDSHYSILYSLYPSKNTHYQLPSSPFSSTPILSSFSSHSELEKIYAQLEQEWVFTQTKHKHLDQISKKIKRLENKRQSYMIEIEKGHQWEKMKHEGDLIKANFHAILKGSSSIRVWDWEAQGEVILQLDPQKSALEQMEEQFKRAKKQQKSILPLERQLSLTEQQIYYFQQQLNLIQKAQTLKELEAISEPLSQKAHSLSSKSIKSSSLYKEYISEKGFKIWIGKNAKANDKLTFQVANGRDWWLHVSGYAGSHVIIRIENQQTLDQETIEDAKLLALYYSQARKQNAAEIILTQRKFVTRSRKNKAGQVQISKHTKTWVQFDPARYQSIKERQLSYNSL